MASDLVGFGATNYKGVWEYLDAPHLTALNEIEESGAISTSSFGGQYLFFRWLTDAYGQELLASLVQTDKIGLENLEENLGSPLGDLAMLWQAALLSTQSTAESSGLDIDPQIYPPYAPVTNLIAPTENPSSGDYYGANGYQQGIDVGSLNYFREGGTTANSTVNEDNTVMLEHSDHSTYVFGQDFFGYVDSGYAAQVVRLVDVPYDATQLSIRASGSFTATVVRAEDITAPNFARDVLYSPTDVNEIELPPIPNDASPIYAIGDISSYGNTILVDLDGQESLADVPDTDRWTIDLSGFPLGQEVRVVAWLDHRYNDISGGATPTNPWMAIVPTAYLPVPTVTGTQQGQCIDGYEFGFPYKMLQHLYSQVFLSSTPFNDDDVGGALVERIPLKRMASILVERCPKKKRRVILTGIETVSLMKMSQNRNRSSLRCT